MVAEVGEVVARHRQCTGKEIILENEKKKNVMGYSGQLLKEIERRNRCTLLTFGSSKFRSHLRIVGHEVVGSSADQATLEALPSRPLNLPLYVL